MVYLKSQITKVYMRCELKLLSLRDTCLKRENISDEGVGCNNKFEQNVYIQFETSIIHNVCTCNTIFTVQNHCQFSMQY